MLQKFLLVSMVIGLSNGNFNYSISFSKSTLLLVLGNSFSLYYCLLNTIKFVCTYLMYYAAIQCTIGVTE